MQILRIFIFVQIQRKCEISIFISICPTSLTTSQKFSGLSLFKLLTYHSKFLEDVEQVNTATCDRSFRVIPFVVLAQINNRSSSSRFLFLLSLSEGVFRGNEIGSSLKMISCTTTSLDQSLITSTSYHTFLTEHVFLNILSFQNV